MSEMIGAGVPASPLEEEEEVGVSLIDGGSLHMEEGKSPVPVAADYLTQKIGELAGFAVGATVLLNILSAGSASGASMNPVRSLRPAIVFNRYEGIWVYMVGPICGTVMGAWAYDLIRCTDKPLTCMRSLGAPL